MTPLGIEPATFQLVAQCLNQLRYHVIEFIIPEFIEGSACFEQHIAHHQELQTVFATSGLYTHVVTSRCQG